MEIRRTIAKTVIRGKVDFAIWIEKDTAVDATPINAALVEDYYRQIKNIAAKTGIPEPADWFSTLLRLPDVTTKSGRLPRPLSTRQYSISSSSGPRKVLP